MSERFYRQQMQYFNIKSVFELGQFHRGEITKRGKRTPAGTKDPKAPKLTKKDLVQKVNNYFPEPIEGLNSTTMKGLTHLLCAIDSALEAYVELLPIIPYSIEAKTPKKDLVKEIQDLLSTKEDLEITGLTIKTLTQLAISISKGINI